jgi:hypothetical protein
MSDKLVTIATFADSIEADLAKQLLADFGIDSVLTGQHAANVYSGLPAVAAIKLETLESQSQKALEILQSNEKREQ